MSGEAPSTPIGSAEVDLARAITGDGAVDHHSNDEIAAWAAVADGVAR